MTCQLEYYRCGPMFWDPCFYEGETCRPAYDGAGNYNPSSGYTVVADGDWGAPGGDGFRHLQYSAGTTDPSVSSRLVLPQGTTCGFHNTRNSPGQTCMGFDPANAITGQPNACPSGWTPKWHFDMSSDSGYFVWCEYQDPNHFCDGACLTSALYNGYACGVSSNTDGTGVGSCANVSTNSSCSGGAFRSPYIDAGRDGGQGIAWCHD